MLLVQFNNGDRNANLYKSRFTCKRNFTKGKNTNSRRTRKCKFYRKKMKNYLEIAILNLMPLKEDTELQLLRKLWASGKSIKITFVKVSSYISKTTAPETYEKILFYI